MKLRTAENTIWLRKENIYLSYRATYFNLEIPLLPETISLLAFIWLFVGISLV